MNYNFNYALLSKLCLRVFSIFAHLANGRLNDGVKATLWGVPVTRHNLLLHLLGEAANLVRQGQNVFVPKLSLTNPWYAVQAAREAHASLSAMT